MQQTPQSKLQNIYTFLSSKTLALALFGGFSIALIPKTLIKDESQPLDLFYKFIVLLIVVNLTLCTCRRFKQLSKPTVFIHIGTLVTLIGTAISSFGYVATVNIYEGSSTSTFYRWDTKNDQPLGFELSVNAINKMYYPSKVKVGVLKGQDKFGLFINKTGESFSVDNFRVTIDSLQVEQKSVTLSIFDNNNKLIGNYNTDSGENSLPAGFPFDFKLVAFQSPAIKRVWTDITLLQNNNTVAQGRAEVNHPFIWQGLRFYNTQIATDNFNRPYAGFQIVKDPGIPVVYTGFFIFTCGCLLWLPIFFKRRR